MKHPDLPPLPPEMADRLEIQEIVGQGGMATVYGVWDRKLRRPLAMKVVRRIEAGSVDETTAASLPRFVRFQEEAQINSQLTHPGIIPVHEVGELLDGSPFFLMRLVRGSSFTQVLEWVGRGDKGWTRTRALGVILNACDAVAFAHSRGVIHRDLKPDNIMVGEFGETYVVDWGLARALDRADREVGHERDVVRVETDRHDARREGDDSSAHTRDGVVLGTPAFMPPEQARGKLEELGLTADVYALGAVLYQLLAGRRPYDGADERLSAENTFARLLRGPPAPVHTLVHDVPPELTAICEKAMEREPAERYPDTHAMAEDIRAYLEQRVVRAYETGAWAELRKWVVRNKTMAILSAGVTLLVVALLSYVAVTQQRAHRAVNRINRELTASQQTLLDRNLQLEAARTLAEQRFDDVIRLADLKELRDLQALEGELWPVHPRIVPALEAWLERAAELVAHLPRHRESLAELQAADAEAGPMGDSAAALPAAGQEWWRETLAQLVQELTAFAGESGTPGTITQVSARLERARSIEQRSLLDHAEAWDEAINELVLGGPLEEFDFAPQMGLVPLEPDPRSGLWEFWHVESGERPRRDPESEEWILSAETGIVLVLLPGDLAWLGSQAEDPDRLHYDPATQPGEVLHQVQLAPFFLSKYELTQGQWLRLMGENPSESAPALRANGLDPGVYPVESVSWFAGEAALARLGMTYPTEAQWEYAARAGTRTPWWTGDDPASLRLAANLADESYRRGNTHPKPSQIWDDGHAHYAPVGSFAANPFGLHDVLGNLFEWCADEFAPYETLPREGDGLRVAGLAGAEMAPRIVRGGDFTSEPEAARAASRESLVPTYRSRVVGLRPAKALER